MKTEKDWLYLREMMYENGVIAIVFSVRNL